MTGTIPVSSADKLAFMRALRAGRHQLGGIATTACLPFHVAAEVMALGVAHGALRIEGKGQDERIVEVVKAEAA